jgi:hypothetical protein
VGAFEFALTLLSLTAIILLEVAVVPPLSVAGQVLARYDNGFKDLTDQFVSGSLPHPYDGLKNPFNPLIRCHMGAAILKRGIIEVEI